MWRELASLRMLHHRSNTKDGATNMKALLSPGHLLLVIVLAALWTDESIAQPHLASPERVIFYTQEWDGARDEYGRPLVSDRILERMRHVGIEEAWSRLREAGYNNQMDTGWEILIPEEVMVGRALTTAFLPRRSELDDRLTAMGRAEGLGGGTNQWPMDLLVNGDVIVVDHYGKPREGAFLGDNLAQAIHTNSGNGAIIYGQGRDITGVRAVEGFNAWVKAWHPSSSNERMLASINEIIRVGEAVVLPGDVVLATEGGVIFIPPQLAESVVLSSEVLRLVDGFRIEAMGEGRYSSQQVYSNTWTEAIENDFFGWLQSERIRLRDEYNTDIEVIDRMIQLRSRNWQEL
jgi:4-hydroxy-4-methyl-2-oxoglutarate aldolase